MFTSGELQGFTLRAEGAVLLLSKMRLAWDASNELICCVSQNAACEREQVVQLDTWCRYICRQAI